MNPRLDKRGIITNICSLLLAAIFVFSGFSKAVDPVGGAIKIGDYLALAGVNTLGHETALAVLSIIESTVEFLLGVHLLMGIRRKLTAVMTLFLMMFMTALTFYMALTNAVVDCGCFGDAVHLSNKATFIKNLILLAASIIVFTAPCKITVWIRRKNQWLAQSYALLFVMGISLYSYYFLPLVDYRPYRVGQNIAEAMKIPADAQAPVFETKFTLEKNGKRKTFTLEDYPDSTWKFIDSETTMVKAGYQPEISDFSLFTLSGDDVTHEVLSVKDYAFWLVFPRIENADNGVIDAIEDLYDYCHRYGYKLYGITASDSLSISNWLHMAGLSFTFYNADDVALKTMIRSNPGLLLVKSGVILNKWSKNNIPDEEKLTSRIEKLSLISGKRSYGIKHTLKYLVVFIIPLIFLTFADKIRADRAKRKNSKRQNKNKNIMRKKIVAGNWKMNLNLQDGVALAKEINAACKAEKPNCDVVICTPFIHLASVAEVLDQDVVALGAENCADKEKGAYTGEVSAEMVKSTGAQYVILGHSERRQYYNETAEILKEKVLLALKNGLKVIFCCGETLEEREAGKENEVVKAELDGSVFNLSAEEWKNIVLAYEPIWAIGTGKTATSDQAEEMLAYIRSIVAEKYGKEAADDTTILYGGSCKPSNAAELFGKPDIDGGLIGGASLKTADFKGIIDAWKK